MYNAEQLINQVINRVTDHLRWKFLNALYFAHPELPIEPHPLQQSPLHEIITTLVKVANGKTEGQNPGEVMEMCQDIAETLYSVPLENAYTIPPHFWETDMGQVILRAQIWASGDELITISDAAELVHGENTQNNRMKIQRAIKRGDLTAYVDKAEPNPQRSTRVSKREVESLE